MNYETEELQSILKKHKDWLEGVGGERADLSNANLSGADLNEADLRDANLRFANLRFANLSSADLSGADLRHADLGFTNLREADLGFTDLRDVDLNEADLRDANTTSVRGIKILSVDNIGTFKGKVTYIPKYDVVFAGCWKGTLEEFWEQGEEMNRDDETEFENIELVYAFFKNNKDVEMSREQKWRTNNGRVNQAS